MENHVSDEYIYNLIKDDFDNQSKNVLVLFKYILIVFLKHHLTTSYKLAKHCDRSTVQKKDVDLATELAKSNTIEMNVKLDCQTFPKPEKKYVIIKRGGVKKTKTAKTKEFDEIVHFVLKKHVNKNARIESKAVKELEKMAKTVISSIAVNLSKRLENVKPTRENLMRATQFV